jgi:3,4-dihydroxy 2-butanone 4-phosphate synthase / GTP cyclohydrolase II
MTFTPIPEVIAAIARGEAIVLVDDEARENEGDIVIAAEHAAPEQIAFMATKACGLICLAMDGQMLDRLRLPLMTRDNREALGTAFTLSVDAADGITTGISAADRSCTVATCIADTAHADDLVTPGHVFPLRAREGGVLVRAGHTEAAVDLARLAGCKPAGVICEIMKPDGEMARLPDLRTYCQEHGLLLASIADLIAYREAREQLIELQASGPVETDVGVFQAYVYRNAITTEHHLALVMGDDLGPEQEQEGDPVLVRVQQETVFGDVLPSTRLPGAGSARHSLRRIAENGRGILLLIHDASGSRMVAQLRHLGGTVHQTHYDNELHMDPRHYGIGAQILRHLGVRRMCLLTSTPQCFHGLGGYGLLIQDYIDPVGVS